MHYKSPEDIIALCEEQTEIYIVFQLIISTSCELLFYLLNHTIKLRNWIQISLIPGWIIQTGFMNWTKWFSEINSKEHSLHESYTTFLINLLRRMPRSTVNNDLVFRRLKIYHRSQIKHLVLGKVILKAMHYKIALLPKSVTNCIT